MKKKIIRCGLSLFFLSAAYFEVSAQLTVNGQLRVRTEYRDGQGAPLPEGINPAIFTSQRARFGVLFNSYRLKLNLTLQDARVWGQDVSTINKSSTQDNNTLMLHEAWAEILLTDTTNKTHQLKLKVGRQELVYDDQRLLGNLDWLQQARRHDAMLLKYETTNWMLHAGFAFNQNKENASGTIYNGTPPGNYPTSTNGSAMYKSLQYLYTGRKLKNGNLSFLFLSDQFSKYHSDSSGSKIYQQDTWGRATTGLYLTNTFNKIGVTGAAYHQFGNTSTGQKLSATLLTGAVQYAFTKKLNAGVGVDYYSGGTSNNTSKAFDPLYGTPHKFAGLMDYYYAASGFGKGGLVDYYLKTKYKVSDKFLLTADIHQFSSAAKITDYDNKNFGQEADIVGSFSLTKMIAFEAGYAHYFSTALLTSSSVKNVHNAKSNANWAYLSINIKPEFIFK